MYVLPGHISNMGQESFQLFKGNTVFAAGGGVWWGGAGMWSGGQSQMETELWPIAMLAFSKDDLLALSCSDVEHGELARLSCFGSYVMALHVDVIDYALLKGRDYVFNIVYS